MFCKKCGKEIADNSTFCQFCGEKQNGASVTINMPQKSKAIAIILCAFFGLAGFHDFYVGDTGRGITKLAILIFLGWCGIGIIINAIWSLIDFVILALYGHESFMTVEEIEQKNIKKQEEEKELEKIREEALKNNEVYQMIKPKEKEQ